MKRGTILAALSLLLPTVAPTTGARASGSVEVTAASQRCGIAMRQTFRKIVSSEQAEGYYAGARAELLRVLGRVLPVVDEVLEKGAAKHAKNLGRFTFAAPLVRCGTGAPCPTLSGVKFPAVLELGSLAAPGDDRHVFVPFVPFRKRPSAEEVAWVREAILAALTVQVPRDDASGVALARSDPASAESKWVHVVAQAQLFAPPGAREAFAAELLQIVRRAAKRAEPVLSGAKGVRLVDYDATLPPYGSGGKLPAQRSAYVNDARWFGEVRFAIGAVEGEKPVLDLAARLSTALAPW